MDCEYLSSETANLRRVLACMHVLYACTYSLRLLFALAWCHEGWLSFVHCSIEILMFCLNVVLNLSVNGCFEAVDLTFALFATPPWDRQLLTTGSYCIEWHHAAAAVAADAASANSVAVGRASCASRSSDIRRTGGILCYSINSLPSRPVAARHPCISLYYLQTGWNYRLQ